MLHLSGQDSRSLARKAGISLEDARRITGAIIGRRQGLRAARNVRREILDRVEALAAPGELRQLDVVDASDGFRKYLFALPDGARVESVRIPLYDTHHVLCVSSQAGCGLACAFCATGEMGLTRSLKSWEIVEQLLHVRADSERPITGVVFMGQGEPFLNYDEVIAAAYTMCDPAACRVDARRISISTAGIVPMIRRYTAERHKFRLCVSLNAAIPWKRAALMPVVEQGFPLDELVDAIREHAAARGRITIEYVMIAGVNMGPEDAAAIGQVLKGIPVRLNPIAVNDARGKYRPPTEEEWNAFRDLLGQALPGQPIVRRYSGGKDRMAACGMLSLRSSKQDS